MYKMLPLFYGFDFEGMGNDFSPKTFAQKHIEDVNRSDRICFILPIKLTDAKMIRCKIYSAWQKNYW